MNCNSSSSERSGLRRKRRNTCSLWLLRLSRVSGAAVVSSVPPSSSPIACAHQRAAAGRGWEGGGRNFGMFIVDPVRAVTNNRCLVLANTIISWHATLLTWIFKGAFPFNLQTQIIPDFGAGVFLSNTTRESGWLYKISAQKKTWRRRESVCVAGFVLSCCSIWTLSKGSSLTRTSLRSNFSLSHRKR